METTRDARWRDSHRGRPRGHSESEIQSSYCGTEQVLPPSHSSFWLLPSLYRMHDPLSHSLLDAHSSHSPFLPHAAMSTHTTMTATTTPFASQLRTITSASTCLLAHGRSGRLLTDVFEKSRSE